MKTLYKTLSLLSLPLTVACGPTGTVDNSSMSKPKTSQIELINEGAQLRFEKSIVSDSINIHYSSGAAPISVTCGDIDSDGRLDIIVASKVGLTIYMNRIPQHNQKPTSRTLESYK